MSKQSKSRRNFLKNSALAAAGVMIVPRHVLGGKGFRAPSDTLYIATVGAGGKGESDMAGFMKSNKSKIAFLCDVDQVKASKSFTTYPEAKKFEDWRELFEKESKNFDAVSVSTPDHMHAAIGSAAITLGKHIWIQKPMAHDIYEARVLADLAKKYKVVSQMGNQGSSDNGVRQMREWYEAGIVGDITDVYCYTNRPVWPQGAMKWTEKAGTPPSTFNWDLWQGTAKARNYPAGINDGGFVIAPFNWRGWWDYGTGVIGDMGAHILEAPMTVLGLGHVSQVQTSVSTPGQGFKNENFLDSCPNSSYTVLTFPKTAKSAGSVRIHWMDGGIMPPRPEELTPTETMNLADGSGMIFIGTKGKMMAGCYSQNAKLLPVSRMEDVNVAEKYARVPQGHYVQWVEACLAGYGKMETSSPFEKAALVTENMLVANLAIRGYNVPKAVEAVSASSTSGAAPSAGSGRGPSFPARNVTLLYDAAKMMVTNIPEVNQFVKREYREGWKLSGV